MTLKKPESNLKGEKEVYILKIYRRSENLSKTLVGTIEEIHGERKGVFKTEKDLLEWLGKIKK